MQQDLPDWVTTPEDLRAFQEGQYEQWRRNNLEASKAFELYGDRESHGLKVILFHYLVKRGIITDDKASPVFTQQELDEYFCEHLREGIKFMKGLTERLKLILNPGPVN